MAYINHNVSTMAMPSGMNRMGQFPLDMSSVYYDYDSLEAYAKSGAIAYVGQVLSLVDEEHSKVTVYSIQDTAGNLKEVGSIPVGDNLSIEVVDGTLKLHDFGTSYYAYIAPNVLSGEYATVEDLPTTFEPELVETIYSKIGDVWYGFEVGGTAWVEIADTSVVRETSSYVLTEGFKSGLEPRVKLNDDNQLEIGWYEPSSETVEGISSKVQSVQQTVEQVEENVAAVESDVIDLQESIYGEGGTAETPAEGSIAWTVDELDAVVGLTDAANGLVADMAAVEARVEALETKEDKDTTYSVVEGDKILSLNGTEFGTTLKISYADNKIALLGINDEEISSFDASAFVADGVLEDASYDAATKQLTFTWNIKLEDGTYKTDVVDISDLVDTYTAGNGLILTGSEFSVDTTVIATVEALNNVKATAEQGVTDAAAAQKAIDDYSAAHAGDYNNDAIDSAISDAINALNINDYAKTADVNTALADYAKTADIQSSLNKANTAVQPADLEDYATNEALVEVSVVANNAATKVDTLEDMIEEITSVGGQPNVIEYIHVNGVNQAPENKVVDITVPTKLADLTDGGDYENRLATVEEKATTNASNLATVTATANAAKSTADANSANITTLNSKVLDLETTVNNETSGVAATYAKVSQNTTDIASLVAKDVTHDSDIANLKTTVANNGTAITQLQADIGNVYTKTEADGKFATIANVGTPDEGKTIVQMIKDAQTAATYDDSEVRGLISNNTSAIEAIYKVDGDTITGVLAEEIERAKVAEKANADAIALLTENPTEAIDSVKELIDYVNEHGVTTDGILTRLDGHDNILAGIGGEGEPATVLAAIEAAAYELPTATLETIGGVKSSEAENEVAVATDGTMSVNAVNINKLTQTEGDTLILCGGDASAI